MAAFERTPRRLHFALRLGGFEQGLNLVDFIDEFVAGHGWRKVNGTTGWAATIKSKPPRKNLHNGTPACVVGVNRFKRGATAWHAGALH